MTITKNKRKKGLKIDNDVAFLRQLTIIAILITLAVLTAIVIFIFSYQDTGQELYFSIEIPEEKITRSIPFEVNVNVDNKTGSLLTDVEASLSLDDGLINLGYDNKYTSINDEIGNVENNSVSKRTYQILPVGKSDSTLTITGTLSYKIGEAVFEKEISREIKISDEALSINIEKPDQVLAGSVFGVTVNYENKSNFDFSNLELEMDYPENFSFVSADLEPDSFTNYWKLGTLKANSKGSLVIRGKLEENRSVPNFGAKLFTVFFGNPYSAADTENKFITSEAPIYLETKIKGTRDYVAEIGDSLQYTIDYKNESGIVLDDVEIKTELKGELFNYNTLVSEGKFNSLTNTLTWDETTNPELGFLEPGESGTVRVNIGLKNIFPIKRINDKNFTLEAKSEIESPSVPHNFSSNKTTSADFLETKVGGLIIVDAQALYRDASSGIANDGPLPPKVGESTKYTIHWIIRNYSTDVEDAKISSELPEDVEWTGIVKSNLDSVPLYNEKNREIVWEIGEIKATKGILDSPVEAIFQVEVTPDKGMVNKFHPLLSKTEAEAEDKFTGTTLKSSDISLNTSLIDDQTVGISEGLVVE
jgi:hypothetical protein